jgi:hypothetical protein
MKASEKKSAKNKQKFVLDITYDSRLNDVRKRLLPTAKYVELNKQVANMKLPNV